MLNTVHRVCAVASCVPRRVLESDIGKAGDHCPYQPCGVWWMLRRCIALCHHLQVSRHLESLDLLQTASYCEALIHKCAQSCWQVPANGHRYSSNASSRVEEATSGTNHQHAAAYPIADNSSKLIHAHEASGTAHASVGVLVRDSSKLQPRLLQPKITPPPETQQKPRRRRRLEPTGSTATTPASKEDLSDAEVELSYFTPTDDAVTTSLEAGFKAAQHLQQQATAPESASALHVNDASDDGVGLSDVSTYGDSSAALLEMQQLQELRQKRGGVLDPEDLEVVQVAKQRAARKLLPMAALATAVMNALEVGKKYGVDPKVLLTQRIAEMRTDLLQTRAAQIKRMLPDTQLREELLARRPEELSGQITRMVAIFRKQLGMDAPADLLMSAWTFAKALRLPDYRLEQHLELLQQHAGSKLRARQLANQYIGTVVSSSFPAIMGRVPKVAAALKLMEADAVELVLAYPFIARTPQQLSHMDDMLQSAPTALGISEEQLLPAFVKHPDLFRYRSMDELVHKYHTLATLFNVSKKDDSEQQARPEAQHQHEASPASPAEILSICSRSKVRQAASMLPIVQSLRTAAAIMGFSNPSDLLPWLLRPPSRRKSRERLYGSGKSLNLNALLQPAETLAARAMFMQQQQGLNRAQIAKLARWAPTEVFLRDVKTQKLKHALLQGQLLGTEIVAGDELDDRMKAMLRKYPRVGNLQIHTVLQRADALDSCLQLQAGQGRNLAIRTPQLMTLPPAQLQQLVLDLSRLLGNKLEAARQLVLQEPKVLLLLRQYQSGSFAPQLECLQTLLRRTRHINADKQVSIAKETAVSTAAAAAVKSAAARAAELGFSDQHGMTGVRRSPRSQSWQTYSRLVYDRAKQYVSRGHTTSLQAACAQDLIRLAVQGPGSAVNLSEDVYTAAEVAAYAEYIHLKQHDWQQQQEKQTNSEFAPLLTDDVLGHGNVSNADVSAAADAARAAVKDAAARAGSLIDGDQHGMACVRRKASGLWETRSYLVYGSGKQYSSVHATALDAACAQDLIRLAMRGPGSAVNLDGDAYTEAEVAAFRKYLQLKKLRWQQEAQGQVLQAPSCSKGEVADAHADSSSSELQGEELFVKCLESAGGRQLLTLKPETIAARLQSLSGVLGLPAPAVCQKALLDKKLGETLKLSAARIEQAAVELQQQMNLSLQQLQQVLRQMPQLLLYRQGVLQAKISELVVPFSSCCLAVQHTTSAEQHAPVMGDASCSTGLATERSSNATGALHELPALLDPFTCLQRAVMYAPQLLGLKTDRVALRLSVLEKVCCSPSWAAYNGQQQTSSLSLQLHSALLDGSIGRWLIAGDASYNTLLSLLEATPSVGSVEKPGSRHKGRRCRSKPVDFAKDVSAPAVAGHPPGALRYVISVPNINLRRLMRAGAAALTLQSRPDCVLGGST